MLQTKQRTTYKKQIQQKRLPEAKRHPFNGSLKTIEYNMSRVVSERRVFLKCFS